MNTSWLLQTIKVLKILTISLDKTLINLIQLEIISIQMLAGLPKRFISKQSLCVLAAHARRSINCTVHPRHSNQYIFTKYVLTLAENLNWLTLYFNLNVNYFPLK